MLEDLFSKVKTRASYDKPRVPKGKVSIPENLMFKCPRCGKVEFMDAFLLGNKVCPSCGYHAHRAGKN